MIAVPIKGKSRSYNVIDETTGEVVETISRRQYDKRFGVLAAQGFNSYEARDKATKYRVEGPFKFAHTKHHIYDLGLPNNLYKSIAHILSKSPHFGTKMYLSMEYSFDSLETGDQGTRAVSGTIKKKADFMIQNMIDEIDEVARQYNTVIIPLGYQLTLIDRSN